MVEVEHCFWSAIMLSDQHIPTRLKGIFYRITIRPAMTYEIEFWKNQEAIHAQNECIRDENVKMDVW